MTWTAVTHHSQGLLPRHTCHLLTLLVLAIPMPLWGEGDTAADSAQPEFLESVYCAVCHANARDATAMRNAQDHGISPYDLWSASSMAHSARDPYWRAALSAEVATVPSARVAIETKCTRCHAPMADASRIQPNGPLLAHLDAATGEPATAMDGVSCTVCHQILPIAPGDESHYSGGFKIGPKGPLFGPHRDPFPMPMRRHTGYTPTFSEHVRAAEFCAPCHTLDTSALAADGQPTGHTLHEQNPYREWRNSLFSQPEVAQGPPRATCQDCHLPTQDHDGQTIKTRIAHNPGGRDFPFLAPRSPFGQHRFLGANTVLAQLVTSLTQTDGTSDVGASTESLTGRVAEIRRHLQEQAARIRIDKPAWTADRLRIPITVENLTGHKFPTAYPSRRAWLQVVVKDAAGTTVFSSGTVNQDGCLVDDQGNILRCEGVGGPVARHRTQIDSSAEVQIYESVMQDPAGRPTFRLLQGAAFGKDNRLLPQGWSSEHPDAATTASVGTTNDDDFRSGSDQVVYSVALDGKGPWTIEVTLNYQSLSARHLAELVSHDTPEIRHFTQLLTPEMRRPEVVAQAALTWTRDAVGAGEP